MTMYVAIHDCGGLIAGQVVFGPLIEPAPVITVDNVEWPTTGMTVPQSMKLKQCKCENPKP